MAADRRRNAIEAARIRDDADNEADNEGQEEEPARKSKKADNYPTTDVSLRTDASFRDRVDAEHHSGNSFFEGNF